MRDITHQLLISGRDDGGRVLNVRLVFAFGKKQDLTLAFSYGRRLRRVKRNPTNHKYTYSLKNQEYVLFIVGV